jgi:hypothetical protein
VLHTCDSRSSCCAPTNPPRYSAVLLSRSIVTPDAVSSYGPVRLSPGQHEANPRRCLTSILSLRHNCGDECPVTYNSLAHLPPAPDHFSQLRRICWRHLLAGKPNASHACTTSGASCLRLRQDATTRDSRCLAHRFGGLRGLGGNRTLRAAIMAVYISPTINHTTTARSPLQSTSWVLLAPAAATTTKCSSSTTWQSEGKKQKGHPLKEGFKFSDTGSRTPG